MPSSLVSRPLRVLTLTPGLGFGGGENRILNLARSVDRDRIKLTVATFYATDPQSEQRSGTLAPEFATSGIPVLSLDLPRARQRSRFRPLQMLFTASTLVRAVLGLRRAILRLNVDVVDAHMDGTLLIATAAAVLARRPIAVTLYHVNTVPPNKALLPLRLLSLRHVSAIITDSEARAEDFARALPPAHAPIHVIPNGVRLPPPSCSRADVLEHFDIPTRGTRIIGQVSGLVPIKGHSVLLQAVAPILAANPDTFLLCAGFVRGSAEHVERLRRDASDLGIAGQVRFGAWPGSIADVWNAIDIHVHASLFDSLPNAILEGMSLGKPAVVTAVGGIPDAVLHNRTGLVVPPNDPVQLREALLMQLNDPVLAARLGAAARDRYLHLYTPECCANAVESVLLEIARGQNSALAVVPA
jgi:glycosyltransferase involved in cell wall biosynthesis